MNEFNIFLFLPPKINMHVSLPHTQKKKIKEKRTRKTSVRAWHRVEPRGRRGDQHRMVSEPNSLETCAMSNA